MNYFFLYLFVLFFLTCGDLLFHKGKKLSCLLYTINSLLSSVVVLLVIALKPFIG